MLMKKYTPILGLDAGQKIVEEAKVFIDLAAVNPETIEDVKMHFYRAEVYFALIELASMKAISGNGLNETLLEEYEAISKESFKKVMADPKKTWKEDAEQFINTRVDMYFKMGVLAYNSNNFEQSTKLFLGAYSTNKFIDVFCASEICKEAYKFAAISLTYYTDSLIDKKEYDKFVVCAGYSDYENEDAYDVLYHYNFDDNYNRWVGFSVPWKKLVDKIQRRYKLLADLIKFILGNKTLLPNALVSVIYMYYDGWSSLEEEKWNIIIPFEIA